MHMLDAVRLKTELWLASYTVPSLIREGLPSTERGTFEVCVLTVCACVRRIAVCMNVSR